MDSRAVMGLTVSALVSFRTAGAGAWTLATGTAGACALTTEAADVFSLSTEAAGDSTLGFGSADF